jgi:hypothetical protein
MRMPPIFITGVPRSGTTLVAMLLNAHPSVLIVDEVQLLDLCRFRDEAARLAGDALAERRRAFEASTPFKLRPEGMSVADFHDRIATCFDSAALVDELLAPLKRKTTSRWGEKCPNYVRDVDDLYHYFGNPLVIFMLRDPRAIVSSHLRYRQAASRTRDDYWISDSVTRAAALVEDYAAPWLERPDRFMTVRYEALVADPASEMRAICDRIDVPFAPSMLHYEATPLPGGFASSQFFREGDLLPWKAANLEPMTSALADRWHQDLSDRQKRDIEAGLAPLIEAFGYAL